MTHWIPINIERLLGINRGNSVILTDRCEQIVGPSGGPILVKMNDEQIGELRRELASALPDNDRNTP